MTADDFADLARHAEAATPGPWRRAGTYVETVPEFDLHRFDVMGIDVAKATMTEADAEFIAAANPATILRLIEDRDALAARLAAVEALADEWERFVATSLLAEDLRAVLSAAPTDTTKETGR